MSNPNVAALSTFNYDYDKVALVSATATITSAVGANLVQIVENIFITSITSTTVGVTISHGTQQIVNSMTLTGFTTQQISGPIVLKEGDYITGAATVNSAVNLMINKRTLG